MKIQLKNLLNLLNQPEKYQTDQQLLADLKAGDERAVLIWFNKYSSKLTDHISFKIDSRADVDDLVQETFLNCLKHLPLYRGQASIWTWMKRIADHQVADFYRKKYAKKAVQVLSLDKLLDQVGVEDSYELSQTVHQALDQIRADYKQLLILKYAQGWSVKKIAEYLERSFKSVEADLFRARQEFKVAYLRLSSI